MDPALVPSIMTSSRPLETRINDAKAFLKEDPALQADFLPFENDCDRRFLDSDSNGDGFLSESDGSIYL